jgi:hypothetical protein
LNGANETKLKDGKCVRSLGLLEDSLYFIAGTTLYIAPIKSFGNVETFTPLTSINGLLSYQPSSNGLTYILTDTGLLEASRNLTTWNDEDHDPLRSTLFNFVIADILGNRSHLFFGFLLN